jgi:GST-like protein
MPTPNGQKVSVALEELELPYEPHRIDILKGDQFDPEFLRINPNGKIPAIIDPTDGDPLPIMESGAILLHLAEKTGRLLPREAARRSRAIQWLFFQVGSVGPMFGQLGHFWMRSQKQDDGAYGLERYRAEVERLLGVLDRELAGKQWLVDEYSVADIAVVPWLNGLDFYGVKSMVSYSRFENVVAWADRFNARPAAARGALVCGQDAPAP